ncbi:MAG TPA: DUF2071 domain-containing protein [Pyrinomonadaceae bacterium]|nr:DUF2071 domain-containing protein [Pyrinomonadaceae bacterium]
MSKEPHVSDRIAARRRPAGWPLMHQAWDKLLFLHWKIDIDVLRPLIPEPLEIDTYEGQAYVAITPLTLWNVRPVFVPPLPWLSSFHELNVRTYVYYDGVPGVWFFSLDANRSLPVWGARTFFHLPYFDANIEFKSKDGKHTFRQSRTTDERARFEATWTPRGDFYHAVPGSLAFFLIERYCLYTSHDNNVYRCRIDHEQWPLRCAELNHFSSDILEADGISTPVGDPIVHAAGPVHVDVWPLERIAAQKSGPFA